MSRVGKNPVQVPQGVEVAFVDGLLTAKGKLGELTLKTRPEIDVKVNDWLRLFQLSRFVQ